VEEPAPPQAPSSSNGRNAPVERPGGKFLDALYVLLWIVAKLLFLLWFRLRVRGRPSPFPRGPLVLAANHVSFLDPVTLALSIRRPVTYMVTSSVFDLPAYRPWMRVFRCIRVEDDAINVEAMRRAVSVLRSGGVVGIFPEGGLSDDGRLKEGQIGVASLLLKGDAPVLTAGIVGTYEALPRHGGFPKPVAVEVRFSKLITPAAIAAHRTPREARRELRDQVMAAIAAVLPARMGGQVDARASGDSNPSA
jgi:1-acyl-sn-glycerol-3-phosphate acyltransferase